MEQLDKPLRSFRKALTSVTLAGLGIHIILLLFLTFSDSLEPMGKSLPAGVYQHLFHLGPFFRETSIQSSDHFVVGLQHDGSWNYVDVSKRHVDRYLDQPWRSYELTIRDFIRDQAVALERARDPHSSKSFPRLLHLTTNEFAEYPTSDSVRWLLIRRWYKTESQTHHPDTVFQLTFATPDAQP